MRRSLMIAGAGVLAAGVLWAGAWGWAASRAGAALEAQAEALGTRGLRLAWSDRETGGFPTRIAVRLSDLTLSAADGSWTLSLPWVEAASAFPGGGPVLATAAPEGALVLAPSPAVPAPLSFAVTSEGLVAELSPRGPMSWRADALTLEHRAETGLREARIALAALSGSVETLPDAAAALTTAAEQATVSAVLDGSGRTVFVAEGATLRARGPAAGPDWLAAARRGEGTAELSLVVGAARAENAEGDVASTGPAQLRLGLADGRLTYIAEADEVRAGVALGAQGPRGAARAARMSAALDVPLAPRPTPQAYSAKLSVDAATLEPALWAALDPAGRLDKTPVSLRGEVGGAASVAEDPGGATPKLSVQTVEIAGARFEGLGATASADGALTVAPGAALPEGRLSVRAVGWEPILAALVEIGVIGPLQAADLMDLAEALRAQDAEPGAFESEIELRGGQVWANGSRVR